MSNCKDCVHSVYDEVWGEIKCKAHGHRIYNQTKFADCSFYRQRERTNMRPFKPKRKQKEGS